MSSDDVGDRVAKLEATTARQDAALARANATLEMLNDNMGKLMERLGGKTQSVASESTRQVMEPNVSAGNSNEETVEIEGRIYVRVKPNGSKEKFKFYTSKVSQKTKLNGIPAKQRNIEEHRQWKVRVEQKLERVGLREIIEDELLLPIE